MTVYEYLQDARTNKQVKEKTINNIKYYYVFESDGWVSVINENYQGLIQAKDEQYADSYCNRYEIPKVPFNVL